MASLSRTVVAEGVEILLLHHRFESKIVSDRSDALRSENDLALPASYSAAKLKARSFELLRPAPAAAAIAAHVLRAARW